MRRGVGSGAADASAAQRGWHADDQIVDVGHRRVLDGCDLGELLRHERARQARQRGLSAVERASAQRWHHVVTRELVTRIEHVRTDRARGKRTLAQRVELATVAQIERHRDHLGALGRGKRGNGLGCGSAAIVGNNDA